MHKVKQEEVSLIPVFWKEIGIKPNTWEKYDVEEILAGFQFTEEEWKTVARSVKKYMVQKGIKLIDACKALEPTISMLYGTNCHLGQGCEELIRMIA
jgi:hypothetical protein